MADWGLSSHNGCYAEFGLNDFIQEPAALVKPQWHPDARPYFAGECKLSTRYWHPDGSWYFDVITNPRAPHQVVRGAVSVASRKRERYILEFRIDSNNIKKFYLCEFCKKSGSIVWVQHRNYAAQHIPRHHPSECDRCKHCDRLVCRQEFEPHVRLCSRQHRNGKGIYRSKRSSSDFTAISLPKFEENQAKLQAAKALADEFEKILKDGGIMVALGGSRDCIGYPVPNDHSENSLLTKNSSSDAPTVPSRDESIRLPLKSALESVLSHPSPPRPKKTFPIAAISGRSLRLGWQGNTTILQIPGAVNTMVDRRVQISQASISRRRSKSTRKCSIETAASDSAEIDSHDRIQVYGKLEGKPISTSVPVTQIVPEEIPIHLSGNSFKKSDTGSTAESSFKEMESFEAMAMNQVENWEAHFGKGVFYDAFEDSISSTFW